MGLDTKYRPQRFADVLGQESSVRVLRQIVSQGLGFRQSYLFAGPFGCGKTTLGRILAKALLCENPDQGEPCLECSSCRDMDDGVSDSFVEVDAATNSGKANIQDILEDLQYQSFSGRRKLYLFDEAHQLSTDALDALLLPLEQSLPNTSDKRMVCIFCTTEPEKMRATILSRCAPVFRVKPLTFEVLASRLAYICEQEKFPYEKDSLELIARATEVHVRDAIKTLECCAPLGGINKDTVGGYLKLDSNLSCLKILNSLDSDLKSAIALAEEALGENSAGTLYQKMIDASMSAYRVYIGMGSDPMWDSGLLKHLSEKGVTLLKYVDFLTDRPQRPTKNMLLCDIAHMAKQEMRSVREVTIVKETETIVNNSSTPGKISVDAASEDSGIYIDPRAVKRKSELEPVKIEVAPHSPLSRETFSSLLKRAVQENRGQKRRNNLDRH